MNKENKFFPELTEDGKKEALVLMSIFKTDAKKILNNLLDEYLGSVYCDILTHIESDSWQNYRNTILDGFKNYKYQESRDYDFKTIRQEIYKENKEEIIKDLNSDLLNEIKSLKKTIEHLQYYIR